MTFDLFVSGSFVATASASLLGGGVSVSSDVSGKSSVSAGKVIEKFFNSDLLIEAYPKSLTKFMEPMIGSPMDAQGPKSVYGCLTMYFISGFGF